MEMMTLILLRFSAERLWFDPSHPNFQKQLTLCPGSKTPPSFSMTTQFFELTRNQMI